MLPKVSQMGAMILVGIVISSVILLEVFTDTSVENYVIPLMTIFCAISAWLLVRSSNKKSSMAGSKVDEQRKEIRPLTKGFLSILGAIGWTGGVAVAVRGGTVPSNVNIILWSLTPAFVLLVIGAVYLLRGFSSDVNNGAD